MDQHLLQGWQEDPFGLHEQRYFSAGRPTKLVRDGRDEAYDEPPAPDVSPDGAVAANFAPAADEAAGAGPEASETPGVYLGRPTRVIRDAAQVGYPAAYRGGQARRRRTGLVNGVVALVAVAAIIVFVAVEGGFSAKNGPKSSGSVPAGTNLAAFVTKSARSTLAEQSAAFTVRGTIDVAGSEADLQGSGQADFAADTLAMNVRTSVAGHTIVENEIVTSQAIYQQFTIGGQSLAQVFGGKHWLEIPLTSGPSQSTPQGSPTSSLQVLEQQGARVTPMGAQDIGGRSCSEYTVTPTQQAMLAAAQQEWSRLGLSNSEIAAARQVLKNSTPPTFMVWFDPKTELTCQLDVFMQFSTGTPAGSGGAPSAATAQMQMTFTHYGVPTRITVPAQSDTVSF